MDRLFRQMRIAISAHTLLLLLVVAGAAALVFLAAVRRETFKSVLSKMADVIEKGFYAVLSVFDQGMEAAKSASNFIYAIRVMLFKDQNEKVTTHVLHSSIFFLSIASYIATYSSMRLILNSGIALFLTFSIQATIVAISISISAKYAIYGERNRDSIQKNKTVGEKKSAFVGNAPEKGVAASDEKSGPWYKNLGITIRRLTTCAVLGFCLGISIIFSYWYILNQYNGSPYTIKSNYYDDVARFNEIASETYVCVMGYEKTDIGNIKNWTTELKNSRDMLAQKRTNIDALIATLENLGSEELGTDAFTNALENVDVSLFKESIYEIRNYSSNTDDSMSTAKQNQMEWKEETAEVGYTVSNLMQFNAWKRAKDGFQDFYKVPNLQAKIEKKKEDGKSEGQARTQVYTEELNVLLDATKQNLSGLPQPYNYAQYSVDTKGLEELISETETLLVDISEDIDDSATLPDSSNLTGQAEQKGQWLAVALAIGIDAIILLLCLLVGKMQRDSAEQEQAKLVSAAATPYAGTQRTDKQAFALGVLSLAGFLSILMVNLFCFWDITWQINFLLIFLMMQVILAADLICIAVEKRREREKRPKGRDIARLTSRLMVKMDEKISNEMRTLMKGMEVGGTGTGKKWLASVPYAASNGTYGTDMRMMIAFLLTKNLIAIKNGRLLFSRTLFEMLIKDAIYEYGDSEWMEELLSEAARHGGGAKSSGKKKAAAGGSGASKK